MNRGTSKTNWFCHNYNFRLSKEMRPIINRFGLIGYAVALLLLEVLTESDDGVFTLHENNREATKHDIGCETDEQFEEYLDYFDKVGLITIQKDLEYTFISSEVLIELRKVQTIKRLNNRETVRDYKEQMKLIQNKYYKEKDLSKRGIGVKRSKITIIKSRTNTGVEFQKRVLRRFPEVEPIKAVMYFIEQIITSDTDYEYYFREMNKDNFERFFISWLKFYVEQNGFTREISNRT